MPMITVEYVEGQISPAQKQALAEEMTHVILQIEGGADTPAGRSIASVRFRAIAPEDWYLGGHTDDTFVSETGKFLIELNVPEGSMGQARKSQCHKAITDAVLRVKGIAATPGATRSVWVQIFEWPEGHLATSGRTSALFGIAKLAGIPMDHPLLAFSRRYFEAKGRMYDAHGFPAETAGRSLVKP
jgi:phenylpyruvate tautomerase PptA (4-oxalocrotonate tautomerase family)